MVPKWISQLIQGARPMCRSADQYCVFMHIEKLNVLITNTSAENFRAPEDFRISSLTKNISFHFISVEKKYILRHLNMVDTSEVLKYYRKSNSLSKLKVMKHNVDCLHLDKPRKRNFLCHCFLTHT